MQTIEQLKKNFISFLAAYEEAPEQVATTIDHEEDDIVDYRQAEWYTQLSVEDRSKIDELEAHKEKVKKSITDNEAGREYKKMEAGIITALLERMGEPETDEDRKEHMGFYEKVELYRKEIISLNKELRILEEQQELNQIVPGTTQTEGERREKLFQEANEKLAKEKKFKEVIGEKELTSLSAGEIYLLKKEGFDLATLFLYPVAGEEGITKQEINKGSELLVNFGGSVEANKIIGAGDLLPFERISEVEINGERGVRKYPPMDGVTRPGYYNSESGKYLSIYDGYNIKILEEKPLAEDEMGEMKKAMDERFVSYRTSEIINYIYSQSLSRDDKEVTLPFKSEHDIDILSNYLKNVFPEDKRDKISFDSETGVLKATGGESIKSLLSSISEYKGKGTRHIQYMGTLSSLEQEYGIPKGVLIRLIYHENRSWEPTARNRDSGAYGLGQMIDGTWAKFGKGLNRNNPHDQLESTARYLKYIKGYRGCTDEMAIALYNTGENFKYNSDRNAPASYVSGNAPIVNKIPGGLRGDGISKREYFIGAVAYYNDLDYRAAKGLSKL